MSGFLDFGEFSIDLGEYFYAFLRFYHRNCLNSENPLNTPMSVSNVLINQLFLIGMDSFAGFEPGKHQ